MATKGEPQTETTEEEPQTMTATETCLKVISENLMPPKDLEAIGDSIFKEIFKEDPKCLFNWKGKINKKETDLKSKISQWTTDWSNLLKALRIEEKDSTASQLRQLYRASAFRYIDKKVRGNSPAWMTDHSEIAKEIGNAGHDKVEGLIKAHYGQAVEKAKSKAKATVFTETYSALAKMVDTMRDKKIRDRLSTGRLYSNVSPEDIKSMKTMLSDVETELKKWLENIGAYKNAIS